MIIPKEILAEKNYTGSRLVEINDPKVVALQKEVAKFGVEAKPYLDKLEELGKVLDPARIKLRELDEKYKKDRETIKEECEFDKLKEEETKAIEALEAIDQRAQAVKNKVTPIVNDILKDELAEFEVARQLELKGEKIYAEIFDEIEEKVKLLRAIKAKR